MKRILLTGAAVLLTVAVVVPAVAIAVLLLAGPHAGLLPRPLEVVVIVTGWLLVFALPVIAGRKMWKRTGKP